MTISIWKINLKKLVLELLQEHIMVPICWFYRCPTPGPQITHRVCMYRSLFVKKSFLKSDPNLTFTSCPNRKSNHISTTTTGKFTIFVPLYRSVIVKKYFQKGDTNLTFTSCPNRKSKCNNYMKKIISQQPKDVNSQSFALLYRSLIF